MLGGDHPLSVSPFVRGRGRSLTNPLRGLLVCVLLAGCDFAATPSPAGIGFSIEPGIYLPEFGVRSEIDCYMSDDGPYASSPVQREIVLIPTIPGNQASRS